ncbi:MAG: hypothetical protein WD602_06370 [Actinomycetota bacterium]
MVKQDLQPRRQSSGSSVAILAIAPVVLFGAVLYHPFIARLPDSAAVGEAMAADTFRWGLSHLAVAVGAGLVLSAFVVIRRILAEAGENRWSAIGLPFVAIGSVLFAVLPGMEVGVMAAVKASGVGAEGAGAAQAALDPWFIPTLVSSSVLFLIGAVGFAGGIIRSEVLSPALTRVVAWGLAIMALARFVPLGAALHVSALAATVALWSLAYELRKRHA